MQDLKRVLDKVPTPFFSYDEAVLEHQVNKLQKGKPDNLEIFYAIKGNANLAILSYFRNRGLGVEIASGGELFLAQKAGFNSGKIIFTGPGKTDQELHDAVNHGISAVHVESIHEARRLNEICRQKRVSQDILIRINAAFEVKTKVQLSGCPSSFGISEEDLHLVLPDILELEFLNFKGIHVYNASGILDYNLLIGNVERVFNLVNVLESTYKIDIPVIDFGGGLGIDYSDLNQHVDVESFYLGLNKLILEFGFQERKLVMEIARFLVAEMGVYVTKVIDKKYSRGEIFIITDGGIHHFLRTALFGENHSAAVIQNVDCTDSESVHVTGCLCTNVDVLLKKVANSLVWKSEWDENRPSIALGAHLDTVPFTAYDWKVTQPCVPVEKDGKIYGRGACDMKAGAAIILDLVLNHDLGSQFNIMAFWYDREEIGIPNGVTDLMNLGYFDHIDLCIIPEPTSCKVNYGVFGNLDVKLIGEGVAVHSSKPKLGRNALYELIPVFEQVKNYPTKTIAGVEEAMSVNMISGGKAINVVPDRIEAKMDFRFDPRISEKEVMDILKTFEREHVKTEVLGCFPGVIHDYENNDILKDLMNIVGDSYVVPFWSDIGQLGTKDIVAVNFGPGSINQAHTADEYVPIKDVVYVRDVILEFLNGKTKL